ncbi:type II secretion system F family protein [Desulfotomaculum copahuensis]|uniref:Type II secretion system protein GspF domain-containing protein n=1 Tax=Desulfotomaculum copahuensis TaxID=1838280 RepID=A0A1B7LG22_9FIRM|nr:type II secretion system F family protein [Desulfotomaculum copahuensis]OAT83692.1 hypothetical protein A6M21_07600 [Desulfotomaculum copahuensis]
MIFALLAGAAVFCLIVGLWAWRNSNPIDERIRRMKGEKTTLRERVAASLRDLGEMAQKRAPRALLDLVGGGRLAVMLRLAGSPFGMTAEEYQGLRLVAAVMGILAAVLCTVSGVGPLPALVFLAAGVALPGLWLERTADKTRRQARRKFGYFIRQLAVGAAGKVALLDIFDDLAGTADRDPLAREAQIIVEDVRRGGKSLSEAVQDMARELDLPEANELAAELAGAERFGGGNLAQDLRRLAHTLDDRKESEDMAAIQKAEVLITAIIAVTVMVSGSIFMVGGMLINFTNVWH